MPLTTRATRCLWPEERKILWTFIVGQDVGSVWSVGSTSREGSHHGGLRIRGDVPEAVLAGNPSVFAARGGVEPDADLGAGDCVGDALRARAAAFCRTSGASEKGCTDAQEDLGSYPDIVCCVECGAEKCDFSIRIQGQSSVHKVPGMCEHVACTAVCIRNHDPDSGRECVASIDGSSQSRAGTQKLETS